jgi:hypothetical protein
MLCFYCSDSKVSHLNHQEDAFVKLGITNWNRAIEKFLKHDRAATHREAIKICLNQYNTIDTALSDQVRKEQYVAQSVLRAIFSSVKYLIRQGIALRGKAFDDGNLIRLLELRGDDIPGLHEWLGRLSSDSPKQRHLLSPAVQNEIVTLYSHSVIKSIVSEIQEQESFAIICDGTQDISGKEQESICLRYVDKNLFAREQFIGLYEVSETTGSSIASMLLDVFHRLGLSLSKLRGQCYDGASNMSGAYRGAQSLILDKQPLAYYTHCSAHRVNLVCQSVTSCEGIRTALAVVHEIGLLFQGTIKFRNTYSLLSSSSNKLRPLCPTRWTVRFTAIDCVIKNYETIIAALEDFENTDTITSEQKAKAHGLLLSMSKASTFLALRVGLNIFGQLENLIRSLSTPNNSQEGTKKAVSICCKEMQTQRDGLDNFFDATCKIAEENMGLKPISLGRARQPPKR